MHRDRQHFRKAVPLFEETHARLVENVKPMLDRKRVPVMGGFIASTAKASAPRWAAAGRLSAAIVGGGLAQHALRYGRT